MRRSFSFSDRVNHDVLLSKLRKRVGDRSPPEIIRRDLAVGILADGVVVEWYEALWK